MGKINRTIFAFYLNREGTRTTPAHRFNDFTIRSYAPVAFRHFRELFNIKPDEFLVRISSSGNARSPKIDLCFRSTSIQYANRYEN